jgi:hypothetical protein
MIPYLARLLDITMNDRSIPGDWKKAIVVPIYKGGDRSVMKHNRPLWVAVQGLIRPTPYTYIGQ